jgi:hypothetical protein
MIRIYDAVYTSFKTKIVRTTFLFCRYDVFLEQTGTFATIRVIILFYVGTFIELKKAVARSAVVSLNKLSKNFKGIEIKIESMAKTPPNSKFKYVSKINAQYGRLI